jgi:hypothetical protein
MLEQRRLSNEVEKMGWKLRRDDDESVCSNRQSTGMDLGSILASARPVDFDGAANGCAKL